MEEEILKKKLIYQSLKRGNKENDIILGNFAQKYVNNMDSKVLEIYSKFLAEDDDLIFKWATGKEKLPEIYMNTIIAKILV